MKWINILVAGCCLFGTMGSQAQAMGYLGFNQNSMVGKHAKDFTLMSAQNQKVNLVQVSKGRKTMIVFWATWCPYCREALKEISLMRQEIQDKGIVLILVSVGESKAAVVNYLNVHQYEFDVVLDENSSVSKDYGIAGVPTIFYLDQEGIIKSVENEFNGNFEKNFRE